MRTTKLPSTWYTSLISLAINKCVASTLRITTALPFTLFAVPITQETTDNAFPVLPVKGHLIAASKSEATGTETLEASGLYKAEWFVHRDSGGDEGRTTNSSRSAGYVWLHHPCLLGVPIVGRVQYGG